ncbi:UNVERIFIED_CONTAM: hypothetical protein GTU68_040058 [Idotea baltica]|nr:hypothetical protein [Idotea baltica]
MLSGKIHRARITMADVDYEGSITIPPELLEMSGIRVNEQVHVWNVTSGNRLETYAISGEAGSTDFCMNGAAAHLMTPGDLVIISSFADVPEELLAEHFPKIVFLDGKNRLKEIRAEVSGKKVSN